ncbi:MAG: ABC transporter permease [Gemmatimonadaceae bacterium]
MTRPASERAYRLLLRCYPKRFRERFEDDMTEFQRDRMRDARQLGWRDALALWCGVLADVARTAPAEHAAAIAAARRERRLARVTRTTSHDTGDGMISSMRHDVRYALRGMGRRPAFTAVILTTLALGIGANAAIFSVVNGILLRSLPFRDADRVVDARHLDPYYSVSEPEFMDYKHEVRAFEQLAANAPADANLSGGDEPERIEAARVSDGFFRILGVPPALGRTFTPEEDTPRSERVIVISDGLWRRHFGADPHIVGKSALINDVPRTIVGVMPPRFDFPGASITVWTPLRLNTDSLWTRNNHYLTMVGKLAPGATVERASAEMNTLDRRWVIAYPETYFPGRPLVSVPMTVADKLLGGTRPYLFALLGAVGFVLLIACVNVANLLLARGESRRKELAIRTALGASRKRIVRQALTESAIFAVAGGTLGLVLAWWGGRVILALAPESVPRVGEIGIDARVLAFTFAISLVTGVLFGLVPALRGSRGDSADTLREGGKTSAAGTSLRSARGALVVAEVALAVVTLTGAGLMVRSLWKLQATEIGFDPSHVMTMQLSLPPKAYETDERIVAFYQQLTERVRAIPGVRAAAVAGQLPMAGGLSMWSIFLDGRVVKVISEAPSAAPQQVTADYFQAMRIPVVRGRAFTDADRDGAPFVTVVNETMAKQFWPGQDAIGHTLKMFNDKSPWATIVGVVKDVRSGGIQEDVPPTMYFPHAQAGKSAYYAPRGMTIAVRTTGEPSSVVPAVRAAVRALDASVPVSLVRPMDEIVSASIASRRFSTALLATFAALALVLAGIGIYGVIAYGVSQRTYEIGLRMALGAQRRSVMALVMTQGMRMAMLGLALGIAGALAVTRALGSLLVGVTAVDVPTLGAVSVALAVVAALACLLPARRATNVSPTEALRTD